MPILTNMSRTDEDLCRLAAREQEPIGAGLVIFRSYKKNNFMENVYIPALKPAGVWFKSERNL